MNKLVRGAIVAAIATLVALTTAVPALAAPAQWETLEVTVHYEQGSPIVLVSGTLPEGTKLPATVELPVPKGGEFQWAGEILGGDPSADPSVEYTVKESGGMDVYSMTLTKAPMGQVEVVLPSAVAFDGSTYRAALGWTALSEVPNVNLFVRIPSGAQVTEPAEGAEVIPGPPGYSYYSRKATDVKPGAKLDLVFAYTAPAGAAAGGAAPGAPAPASNNTLPMVLIIAFVVGALALVYIGVKGKMAGGAAEEVVEEAPKRSARTATVTADVANDSPEEEDAPVRKSKAPLIVGIVVVGIVVAGALAANSGTGTKQFGNEFVRDFGNPSACTSTSVKLNVPQGEDPEQVAEKVFSAAKGVESVGMVTVDIAAGTAKIAYCESSASKEQVLAAVGTTGMLAGELDTQSQDAPVEAAPGAPAPGAPATATPAP